MFNDDDELLTTRELAAQLKESPRKLEGWRPKGIGPLSFSFNRTDQSGTGVVRFASGFLRARCQEHLTSPVAARRRSPN